MDARGGSPRGVERNWDVVSWGQIVDGFKEVLDECVARESAHPVGGSGKEYVGISKDVKLMVGRRLGAEEEVKATGVN